jgi:hypothetical protein
VLLAFLSGCAVNPVTGQRELSLVGEDWELEVGETNYAPLRQIQGGDYATDPELVTGYRSWIDRVEVPASFTGLVEFRLGQQDRKAMGFAVHVPHYLAQSAFPESAVALSRAVTQVTGLVVPTEPLEKASASTMSDIAEEVAGSTEVQELVGSLEQQYDAMTAEGIDQVPSADEIAAEFERFIAELDKNTE